MNAEATDPQGEPEGATASPAAEPRASTTAADVSDAVATEGKRKKAPAKPSITAIDDVVRAAFTSRGRLLDISGDTLKKLPVDDTSITHQSALTCEFAAADPAMTGTFRILQLVASKGIDLHRGDTNLSTVLNRLVDLAVVAMAHHTVFRVWSDQLVDPKAEPQLTARSVRQFARETTAEKVGLAEDDFPKGDQLQLQSNAVACFALLRIVRGPWSLDDFVDAMRENDWVHHATLDANSRKAAAAIAADRQRDVLEVVSSRYLRTITALERRIESLNRAAEASANREARLEAELRETRAREGDQTRRAEEYAEQIVRLQKELAHERENRAVDRSHMSDDYEILRTRIIRLVGSEVGLLTDGLHALRNGAPEVADEFLDRSLTALTREVQELRAAGGAE